MLWITFKNILSPIGMCVLTTYCLINTEFLSSVRYFILDGAYILKNPLSIADFSNAVQVTKDSPMRSDFAGVVFWQVSLFIASCSRLFEYLFHPFITFRPQKSESKQPLIVHA